MNVISLRSRYLGIAMAALICVGTLGCASGAGKGAAIGGAAGGVIGGVIGNQSDNTVIGAIMGAAIGGAAGAAIGDYMDRQARELDSELENATVERVGEGIKITFDSGVLFAVDRSNLSAEARQNLTDLADVLKKYEDTNILIEGHTDATGSDAYNQTLSEQRARSVSAYLASQNVSSARMTEKGYGESQPVASNDTADGRRANRRVDVAIIANEELKDKAQDGEI